MTRGQGDIVTFDILCGDFNFDNISPGISPSLCLILRSMHTDNIASDDQSFTCALACKHLRWDGTTSYCDVCPIKINN